MSFEKPNMDGEQKPIQESEDNLVTPKEKIELLSADLKVSFDKLRKLSADFSDLSEEDYFKSKKSLEEIGDKIHNIKVDIQLVEDKIIKILEIQNNIFEN